MKFNEQHSQAVKRQYKTLELDYTPLDLTTAIPSKAMFYKSKIAYIRGLRFKEQLSITNIQNTSTQNKKIALDNVCRIYNECIQIDELELQNMLYDDFQTLCSWIVLLTNPKQEYTLQFYCEKCQELNTHTIKVADGTIEYRDFQLFEPTTLDVEFGKIILAPLTIDDFLEYYDFETEFKQEMYASAFIKKLNGLELTTEQRIDLLSNLSLDDVTKITEIVIKYQTQVTPLKKQCAKCQHDNNVYPMIDIIKGLP